VGSGRNVGESGSGWPWDYPSTEIKLSTVAPEPQGISNTSEAGGVGSGCATVGPGVSGDGATYFTKKTRNNQLSWNF